MYEEKAEQYSADQQSKYGGSALSGVMPGTGSIGGALAAECGKPDRSGLRDRVAKQLEYAQTEARKTSKLRELFRLLEKNPEVARILDLIEEVR